MPLPLWVWIEYGPVLPRYIELNLLLLRRHAPPAFELRVLNRSNLGNYLSLPPEFARIPYAVAASDFARIGLLATYGGAYVDADFLINQNLAPLAALITKYDIVGYSDAGDAGCSQGFAANFLVVRPNSTVFVRAWTSLTTK